MNLDEQLQLVMTMIFGVLEYFCSLSPTESMIELCVFMIVYLFCAAAPLNVLIFHLYLNLNLQ